ncbi:MAG: transposase [Bacteroidetes bacterium]|nr:transposase [Bacteroidota bacterium]
MSLHFGKLPQHISEKEMNHYLDYRDNLQKQMKLSGIEFLMRFCQHILAKGFVRIRYYGLLSATKRKQLRLLQKEFGIHTPEKREKKNRKTYMKRGQDRIPPPLLRGKLCNTASSANLKVRRD